jgi:pilus assembly protein CpaD
MSGIALTACAKKVSPYEITGAVPEDYRTMHPITIEEKVSVIDVPVSADSAILPAAQRANVQAFADAFIRSGTSTIAVVAPSGSPNQLAAASIAVQIEAVLRASGVNPRAIDYRVYRASAAEKIAPVRVAFNSVAAVTQPCGPWMDQSSSNGQNDHYGAFGCASQQNLAAMVENPLDLLYPRGLTPADAARRSTVLEKYRLGQPFSGDTSQQTGGSVATGVGTP